MRTIQLILLFAICGYPKISDAQLDTLVISFSQDYVAVKNSLHSDSTRKLTINLDDFPPYKSATFPDKQARNIFSEILDLLDKKLPEVRVLYIVNPTTFGVQDASDTIKYDTAYCSIYKLNFKKMTSLEKFFMVGNDVDDIIQMPTAFYTTPTKTIYYRNLSFSHRLKKDIKRNSNEIKFIRVRDKDMDMINRVFGF